jgi:hypothetical protein
LASRIRCRVEEAVVENVELVERGADVEFEDLVKELDSILEAWFMAEVAPSLDEASRSRVASAARPSAA